MNERYFLDCISDRQYLMIITIIIMMTYFWIWHCWVVILIAGGLLQSSSLVTWWSWGMWRVCSSCFCQTTWNFLVPGGFGLATPAAPVGRWWICPGSVPVGATGEVWKLSRSWPCCLWTVDDLHWENSLHFGNAPSCLSVFYSRNCIYAPPKII